MNPDNNEQLLAMPSVDLATLYLQKREALSDEERAAILAVLKDATANGCFVVKADEAPNCWADSKPLGVNGKVEQDAKGIKATYEATPEGKAFMNVIEKARRMRELDKAIQRAIGKYGLQVLELPMKYWKLVSNE